MKPFVSLNDIRSWENDFAKDSTIADALDTCLNTDILPNRARHPFRFSFDPSQVSLYVSRRTLRNPAVFDSTDEDFGMSMRYPAYFGEGAMKNKTAAAFASWGPREAESLRWSISLRWYYPERSGHSEEFERTIVIWFDANAATDNERLNQTFFTSAQNWIRAACAHKRVDIDAVVARRPLPKQNAESWVLLALEEISVISRTPNPSIEYLVVFVDNMDQCPVKVQKRLLTTIESWLEMPTLNIWKVILTMWPSTYSTLQNSTVNNMRNWKVLRIGPVQPEALFENRRNVINSRISKLFQRTTDTVTSKRVSHHDFPSFIDASLRLWSQRLGGTVADLDDSGESDPVTTAGGLIRELCNGDLRRELGLLHGFVTGEGAHRIWQQTTSEAAARRHDYEIVESLLLGRFDHLMQSGDHVGNLFMLGHQQQMPRDLLIGPHMLFLIKECGTIHEYQALCRTLADIGYADNNFDHCFTEFRQLGLLHEVSSDRIHGVGYEAHHTVIDAYHRLLFHEPAYLDCVAPVTAVDDECLNEMRAIYKSRDTAFVRKTEYALAFLKFLRRIETAFGDASRVRSAARQDFASKLETAAIPCLWKHLAVRYRKRLVGLRASRYRPQSDEHWWDETIGHPLFVGAANAPETLTCSGV